MQRLQGQHRGHLRGRQRRPAHPRRGEQVRIVRIRENLAPVRGEEREHAARRDQVPGQRRRVQELPVRPARNPARQTLSQRHHRWKLNDSDLRNFDVLPAKVAAQYPGSGIRPDLLFDFTDQGHEKRLAGEARGRSSARPVHFASKDQRDRLADIVAWSGVNDLHPVTMTYAFTGAASAQVDLFDITVPDHLDTVPEIIVADEEGLVTTRTGRRFERMASIRPRALGRAREITDQLYETAPQGARGPTRSVYGRNVRGSWASADLIASSGLRFFLGLLDQPLTPEEAGAPRRRRSAAMGRDADPIQVAATGRILVVVARDAAQDPDWSEVTSRIE
jgi:hypothetical protein